MMLIIGGIVGVIVIIIVGKSIVVDDHLEMLLILFSTKLLNDMTKPTSISTK